MSDKISIIIPIHNGEKYIKKLVDNIFLQTYENIEIILVENNSNDKSEKICKELSAKNNKIITITTKERGTSIARKLGVQRSSGRYIIFIDQDDGFVEKRAVEKMHQAIREDQVQICQFSYYQTYFGVFKRLKRLSTNNLIYTKEQLLKDEIKGIFGIKGSKFNSTVWSKIYDGDVLRRIVQNIKAELYFAEDVYFNIWAFFDKDVKCVSVRNEAYYGWRYGAGFSSNVKSGLALFKDYEIVKPLSLEVLRTNKCDEKIIFRCLNETIWFHRYLINEMILAGNSRECVEQSIAEMGKTLFVQQAKKYFQEQPKIEMGEEFLFLISDYTPQEYYEWCIRRLPTKTIKEIFKSLIIKICRLGKRDK